MEIVETWYFQIWVNFGGMAGNVSSWRNTQIKFTHHDETKKRAHDSQIVRA